PSLTLYFCNDPAPADLHTLSLHDALPILAAGDNGAMPIGEAMRTDLPAVPPSTSEAEAAELMRTHYTRHLLVEEKGQVVGIISMRDVIQLMLDDKQFLIEQLQTYIDGR